MRLAFTYKFHALPAHTAFSRHCTKLYVQTRKIENPFRAVLCVLFANFTTTGYIKWTFNWLERHLRNVFCAWNVKLVLKICLHSMYTVIISSEFFGKFIRVVEYYVASFQKWKKFLSNLIFTVFFCFTSFENLFK